MGSSSTNHHADEYDNSDESMERKIAELKEINKKQEKRVNNLEEKAMQDINRYFVFQAVILASISANTFKCRHWWVPLTVSASAGALNLVNLFVNYMEFLNCSRELDKNMARLDSYKKRLHQRQRRQGSRRRWPQDDQPSIELESPDSVKIWCRTILCYFNLLMCFACLVSVIVGFCLNCADK